MSKAIALRAPPLPVLRTEPASGLGHSAGIDYREEAREKLQAAQLRSIRLEGTALRACWAMLGLCRKAEKAGVDTAYWRTLAAELEASARS